MKLKNEIKRKVLLNLLEEYSKTKSIHAACEACALLVEEIESGRLVL